MLPPPIHPFPKTVSRSFSCEEKSDRYLYNGHEEQQAQSDISRKYYQSSNSYGYKFRVFHYIDEILSYILRNSYWLADRLRGGKIYNQYKEIKYLKSLSVSPDVNSKLHDLLKHAVKNSLFYSHCNPENLSSFPIVTKEILIENQNLNTVPTECLPWQHCDYVIQLTSGSTGTPFAIPMDSRKRQRRVAELKYFGEIVGFKSHDRLMQLRIWSKWQRKSRIRQLRENIIAWDISNQSEENLNILYNELRKKRCVAIRGYASSIDNLAKFVKRNNFPKLPYLRISIAGSEALYDETKDIVEDYLGGRIISQYANEENGIIAQQTIDGRLKGGFEINNGSYVIEVFKMDSDDTAQYGELGRIVITDLYNYAFPMIRYENGDCGVLEKTSDGEIYFSKIYGRIMDLVYSTDGSPISPMTLARVLKNISGIRQWQFIQDTESKYTIKVIPSDFSTFDSGEIIKNELLQYFGSDAEINVELTDKIPLLKSGKRKSVICKLTK